jgi:hypothetical protein
MELLFIITMIQVVFMLVLLFFIIRNRYLLVQLKSHINEYIDTDMKNLKEVLETSMQNDKKLYDKQQFILNVLEEDGQINMVNDTESDDIKLDPSTMLPGSGEAWYDNIVSGNLFTKYLNINKN